MANSGIKKTLGDLTNDENIINVVSQSEEDHLIKYSEEAPKIPSKLKASNHITPHTIRKNIKKLNNLKSIK